MNMFSKVYVEATVAKTTFMPCDFQKKKKKKKKKKKSACLDFLCNYLQIAFVSVAYNLCIITAKIRFVLGVIEALTKQKTSEF